jgi:hypothetical protein
MYRIFYPLCVALGFSSVAIAQTPWATDSIRWFCDPAGVEQLCTLEVIGPTPAGLPVGAQATGTLRVLKGRTAGQGLPLQTVPITLPCTIIGSITRCFVVGALRLGVNVRTALSDTLNTLTINIYSDLPGKLFDWDGDGVISADKEGLMLLRGLLGFNGAAISDGITLTNGRTAITAEQAVYMGVHNSWFQFIAPAEVPKPLREGLLFQRCVLGLRGAPLTAGLTDAAAAGIGTQCDSLLASE